jgi:Ca2+/Na+ antiporter
MICYGHSFTLLLLLLLLLLVVVVVVVVFKNCVIFNPQSNYTDWATAACRWILVPTFADREVSRDQRDGTPTADDLAFLDRSCHFFFQLAPHLSSWGWLNPVPDPPLFRKSGSAGNLTRHLWICSQELWPDHRGGLMVVLLVLVIVVVLLAIVCRRLQLQELKTVSVLGAYL